MKTKNKENSHVINYKKNYKTQILKLQELTSFFVEFIDKANLPPETTKKFIHKLGEFRESFYSRGKDNRNAYFRACEQIDNLRDIIKLLRDKINYEK